MFHVIRSRKCPRTPFLKGELRSMLQFLARCISDLLLFEKIKFASLSTLHGLLIPPLERGLGGFVIAASRAVWMHPDINPPPKSKT